MTHCMSSNIVMLDAPSQTALHSYSAEELARIFRKMDVHPVPVGMERGHADGVLILGTWQSNPAIRPFFDESFLGSELKAQGYAIRCVPDPGDAERWVLAIAGADDCGALYGLRDLEHYHASRFRFDGGRLRCEPFACHDWPRIEHRGHWIWGCNMPDKRAWLENMSRWKLNELIHWDNVPPEKGKEYVEFAHSRGIRLNWGFGWGWGHWNVDLPADFVPGQGGAPLCPSHEFDRAFYRRVILEKIRNLYVPTGCDGIYFQSFTEFPKCTCPQCSAKTMGQLMVEFCNPILADIFAEFPDLWVSCGIHANFGEYTFLRELDRRCNIYWENCDSGTSVRGDDEDFGYLNKTLPYGHGFGPDVPADPEYTEESLNAWMASNAGRYRLDGPIEAYYEAMSELQRWSRGLLGKPSGKKHAGTVADHSVFCRRTPFPHVALAEAQWNPYADTQSTVDAIVRCLGIEESISGHVKGVVWTPKNASGPSTCRFHDDEPRPDVTP